MTLHRNRLSEINLRYGSITVRALREFYGSFAPHCADSEKLRKYLRTWTKPRSPSSSAIIKPESWIGFVRTPLDLPRRAGLKRESHGNPGDDRNKRL